MSVALSLIASSKKYPLNLGFSKEPRDLVAHKPFKYEWWGPNSLWLFWQIHFKELLIFTFNLSSKESKLQFSPSSTLTAFSIWHWTLTLCHLHMYAYMHMNTHANTYRQNHWNGPAYGKKPRWRFKHVHWLLPQRERGRNEKHAETSTSVNILIRPIFNRGCTHDNLVQYNLSAPDMLNGRGNTLHTASFKIILCPGLFRSKTW